MLPKKLVAEFLGTFMIVFGGCGAIAVNQLTGGAVSHVGIAITFGLCVMTMIYAVGHISGAHFNPAVTIAFALTRHFPKQEVLPYIGAQLLGALSASFFLTYNLTPILSSLTENTIINIGVTQPIDHQFATAFYWEFLLTFFLMFVIMSVATDYRAVSSNAGWAIGGVVWLEATFAGPISNASMNPARSIGPAVASGEYTHLLAYIGAPILGAVAGAFLYNYIRCDEHKENEIKGCC